MNEDLDAVMACMKLMCKNLDKLSRRVAAVEELNRDLARSIKSMLLKQKHNDQRAA